MNRDFERVLEPHPHQSCAQPVFLKLRKDALGAAEGAVPASANGEGVFSFDLAVNGRE
ncbi:MAG TPA: hypothetical protein VHT03_11705 [Rhizomicrobium sp.]|jgi:hypothetical protein|nr:hypothetical protein [Rhizomicrobium sp.]